MAGEGQLMEQARKLWERLNAKGQKIINELLTTDAGKVEWPEDAEPKFIRKKATRATKMPMTPRQKDTHTTITRQ